VPVEIRPVRRRRVGVALDDQDVFGVALLRGLGEVKRAGNHGVGVDEDDFVLRDGVFPIDVDRDAVIREKRRGRVGAGLFGLSRGSPSRLARADDCVGRPAARGEMGFTSPPIAKGVADAKARDCEANRVQAYELLIVRPAGNVAGA
jgi:hypothetical protein